MTSTSPRPTAPSQEEKSQADATGELPDMASGKSVTRIDEELKSRLSMARTWGEDLSNTLKHMMKQELQDMGSLLHTQVHTELQSFRTDVHKKLEELGPSIERASLLAVSEAAAASARSFLLAAPASRAPGASRKLSPESRRKSQGATQETSESKRKSQVRKTHAAPGQEEAMPELPGPSRSVSAPSVGCPEGAAREDGRHAMRSFKVHKIDQRLQNKIPQHVRESICAGSSDVNKFINSTDFKSLMNEDNGGAKASTTGGSSHGHTPAVTPRASTAITILRAGTIAVPRSARQLYGNIALMVCSDSFNIVSGLLVFLNSVSIGIQTDYIAAEETEEIPMTFRIIELIFCVCFTLELAMRLFVHRCSFFTMPGWHWNWFDFFVVMMQLMEELTESLFNFVDLQAMRVLRVLRLIRIVRFIRVIHLIGELRTLATSIASSLRSLMWTIVMLLLLMYIIGVSLTQIVATYSITAPVSEQVDLRSKFGSVYRSILTLYQCNTGGMDWKDAVDPLQDYISPWLALFFCMYVAFVVLAIMNVVTGVFVESALKSAKDDKETIIVNHMRELFANAEGNELTWGEFQAMTGSPEMMDYFQTIDVDPSEAEIVFKLLDIDGNGKVCEDEFTNGCLKLTGPAKALDLALLCNEVRSIAMWIEAHLCNVERLLNPRGPADTGGHVHDVFLQSSSGSQLPGAQADDLSGIPPNVGVATQDAPMELH